MTTDLARHIHATSFMGSHVGSTGQERWSDLCSLRGDICERSEKYAHWTIPAVFPPAHHQNSEHEYSVLGIGSRGLNHFANKMAVALFPPTRSFFRNELPADVKSELNEAGIDEQQQQLMLSQLEDLALRGLDKRALRQEAVVIIKLLIVTGNALMFVPPVGNKKVRAKSIRSYCTLRDVDGTVREFVTKELKPLHALDPSVQDLLRASSDEYKDRDKEVGLYTWGIIRDGQVMVQQYADNVKLNFSAQYPVTASPWIFLTWTLYPGDHYGRGLVEQHSADFNTLEVLSTAFEEGVCAAAETKFLVRPGAAVDAKELNKSPNGSYHTGVDGDIVPVTVGKNADYSIVSAYIEKLESRLSQIFLMLTGAIRDAERVTSEEIRRIAHELDSAHAGVYSRLAMEWQVPLATLSLRDLDLRVGSTVIEPRVITGLENLSRAGDMDNLRAALVDLSGFAALPEAWQAEFNTAALLNFVLSSRGLQSEQLLKPVEQKAVEQQQQADAIAQQQAHEITTKAAPTLAQKVID